MDLPILPLLVFLYVRKNTLLDNRIKLRGVNRILQFAGDVNTKKHFRGKNQNTALYVMQDRIKLYLLYYTSPK